MPRKPSITDDRAVKQAKELIDRGLAYVEPRTNKKGKPEFILVSKSGSPASASIIKNKSHFPMTEGL